MSIMWLDRNCKQNLYICKRKNIDVSRETETFADLAGIFYIFNGLFIESFPFQVFCQLVHFHAKREVCRFISCLCRSLPQTTFWVLLLGTEGILKMDNSELNLIYNISPSVLLYTLFCLITFCCFSKPNNKQNICMESRMQWFIPH